MADDKPYCLIMFLFSQQLAKLPLKSALLWRPLMEDAKLKDLPMGHAIENSHLFSLKRFPSLAIPEEPLQLCVKLTANV